MEHEGNEQDFSVEQEIVESSLNLEDVHTTSPHFIGGMSQRELLNTDPIHFSERWLLSQQQASAQVRVQAVQALQGATDPGAIAQLLQWLHDEAVEVRIAALEVLGTWGEHIPVKEMLPCLRDEEAVVRIVALQVLGALGKRVSVEYLQPTLRDPDWTVRETAVLTLGKRLPQKVQVALYDEEKFVREAAIYALGRRLPIKNLINDLQHGEVKVRINAARVLGEIEGLAEPTQPEEYAALNALIDAVQQDTQSAVRKEAILALGQLEIVTPPASLPVVLRAACRDSDQDVRNAAEIVLDAKGILLIPDSDAGMLYVGEDMDASRALWPSMQETETHDDVQIDNKGAQANVGGKKKGKVTNYVGQRFGSYILNDIIGEGGRATVYLGKHIYLKTQVAVKVLKLHLPEGELQGFLNEAQMVAKLKHPAIVRVLDFGVASNVPFLVMDYAPQGNLRQRYPRGVRAPSAVLVPYIKQIASALQYAHTQGVIHRDVKPENILLGADTALLLSDFGIAQLERNPANPYQNRDKVSGTLPYMAPEQWQGEPCAASDQYALAVVAYELLCGTVPFQGATLYEFMNHHLHDRPPSLREQAPNVSPEVEDVVLTALAKNPKRRFTNVEDFADAFTAAASPTSSPYLKRQMKRWLRFMKGMRRP
ncbi:MAG: protein kinase domain-containing protein [Ktedonobacteraceae bacterium]